MKAKEIICEKKFLRLKNDGRRSLAKMRNQKRSKIHYYFYKKKNYKKMKI
jgi:hypothetical protein